jgi:HK97 family phage major capsid protein
VEGNGQEAIATDKLNILEPLRANLVLTNAGANYLSNLRGNVSIPTYSGTSTLWAGEVADAQDGAGTFGSVEFMPKRITSYIDVSRQFLLQDSVSAEQMLKNDIVKSITNKLEATILGAEEGTNNKPAGLFVGATEVSKFDYATIVDMIAQLETNNVSGNFAFIMNPAIKALLKVTSKDSGSGRFICENDMIDGIPVYTTSAAKGIVLGNWDDLIVATWSGLDLLVDNVTLATQGKVRIVVNAYVDVAPRRAESFVCKTV